MSNLGPSLALEKNHDVNNRNSLPEVPQPVVITIRIDQTRRMLD